MVEQRATRGGKRGAEAVKPPAEAKRAAASPAVSLHPPYTLTTPSMHMETLLTPSIHPPHTLHHTPSIQTRLPRSSRPPARRWQPSPQPHYTLPTHSIHTPYTFRTPSSHPPDTPPAPSTHPPYTL